VTPLYTVSVPFGSFASYQGKALTKDSTAEFSYEFAGWDKDPAKTPIEDNTRFNAVFKASTLSYTASFYQESDDTTPLYSVLVPYGSYATYLGEEPKKARG
jgi:5-formaminoimidazole-4-carboxamide-1-beta-D-ribofuranosyl 5'-monophosphate synthetase